MRSSQCPQWEVSVAVSPRGVAKLASNSELVKLLLFWNRKSSSGTQQRRWQQECNGGRVDIISQGEELQDGSILVKNEECLQTLEGILIG